MNRVYQQKYAVSISAGVASFNTIEFRGSISSIIIAPTTSTTSWRFSLTNDDSAIAYRKAGKGSYVDNNGIPAYGIYTGAFSNVSVDEVIHVTFNYEERQ